MTDWTALMDAGKELNQAFSLLDRAAEIGAVTLAAAITKSGLLQAARDAVARAECRLGR